MKRNSLIGTLALVFSIALLLDGCAASQSGGAYSRAQARTLQQVQLGVVSSVRPVRIEGTKSGVGAVGGGALGGIAGSSVGSDNRVQAAAGVAGAILGGLAGAAAEEGITRTNGLEIVVRLDSGGLVAITQAADRPFNPGDRVQIITASDGAARVAPYF